MIFVNFVLDNKINLFVKYFSFNICCFFEFKRNLKKNFNICCYYNDLGVILIRINVFFEKLLVCSKI